MKNRKNMVVAGIAGLIFVAAIVVFVLAYRQDHANPPILLQVCHLPDGRAQYVEDGFDDPMLESDRACTNPKSIQWDTDALTVAIVSAVDGSVLDGSGDERVVVDAMIMANRQLDTNMTLVQSTSADIVVTWRAAFEVGGSDPTNDSAGYCLHRWDGERLRAAMAVRPSGNIRCEYQTALHEFGHCLGLGHSSWGVMRQDYACGDRDAERMQPDRFGDQQVDLMQSVYP